MLIIDRALMREILQTSLAVALIFISLFVVVSLVKVLSKAAAGVVPVDTVFILLGLETVKVLAMLLPLALFVGILLCVGRWYRDSEMTVLFSCGIGLSHFLRPVLLLTSAFALVAALFSFYLSPLSSKLIAKVKSDDSSRYEIGGITPGVFNEVRRRGGGVFYVEEANRKDESLGNIFVSNEQLGKYGVLVAKTGYYYTNSSTGNQFLLLEDGTRYEGTPGQADYRILEFRTYAIRIEPASPRMPASGYDSRSTRELLQSSDDGAIAEFHWRLSKPLSLFILAVLALVFAFTNPRGGRYLGLFVAILVYFVYSNLLGIGDAMLKRGRIPGELGLWWVHAVFLAAAVYLLWRRSAHKPLLPHLGRG